MRVIAGEKKGHALTAVPGRQTRPTSDKVKESIFNMIGPYFSGGCALDLFAGTGGLGIEALSRGVAHVVFVDQSRQAVETTIRNLTRTRLRERADVYRNDAIRALQILTGKRKRFDYIFLDPPYAHKTLASLLSVISDFHLLCHDGLVICEHSTDETIESGHRWRLVRAQAYGDTSIGIYALNPEADHQDD